MMRQAVCTANKNDYPTASYAVAVSDMLFCGALASFSAGPPHGLEKKCGLKHTQFDITGSFLIGVGYSLPLAILFQRRSHSILGQH